ncbi:SRPBCC family protein [Brevibacillus marinus]|uniref:SRPBCC family protein n=1 Tax=Brevibacillus marinus TaxID=2496837 RepID=UPI000F83CCAA|nr:SRPBCC domain-containing protein [Brevibacillus marinus]
MVEKVVGQTASVGFQVGVRRTLPISPERAWAFLTSAEGVKLWLGDVPPPSFRVGETFRSTEGLSGEFRVVKEMQQLRLRWKKPDWPFTSTLQIRLLPTTSGKTTISFHQEKLDHAKTREEMKKHWEAVLNAIREKTVNRTSERRGEHEDE